MDIISKLEAEILLEIFNYLDSKDLTSLLLTCKRFNVLISTNTAFTRNFQLKLTKERSCKRFRSSRKYPRVKLSFCEGFLHIFDQIGATVCHFELDCDEGNLNSLRKIFVMCSRLKVVVLRGFQEFRGFNESLNNFELPKLNLRILKHFCKFNLLCLFEKSSVEYLEVYGYPEVTEGLKSFLPTQSNLKSLKLSHFYKNSTLFNDGSLTLVNFELLELRLHSFHNFNNSHLAMFLMNHFDSLSYLEVNNVNVEVFKILCHFKHLKNLKIHNVEGDFEEMPHVERVEVGRVLASFGEKFPKVMELKFRDSYYKSSAERREFVSCSRMEGEIE